MSKKCSRLRIYLQIFMVTIKQIPTDNSLTASTNVISMQYPNTILNTKMTLPQLVGPIDVVSPEHSSGDRSHEFQIASSKNASIEFSKAEYARPTKAELAHCTTSARLSKYAQSQKLSSLTSQKYWIFPHPLSREASSIHGVARTDTHTELKLFQPPTSTPKKTRQDQTLPYPQVSMVTRCVTSAETQNSPYKALKVWHFLAFSVHVYIPGDDT